VGDEPKDVLKEIFLHREDRAAAERVFRALVEASGATRIEAQTNDRLLTQLLLSNVETVERDRILFEDVVTTKHSVPGAAFRSITESDREGVFAHDSMPVGDWVVELGGEVVATGGLMLHYNPPFSDIYMTVARPFRRGGIGTLIVQELKRISYEMGKTPAARCDAANVASRRTLQRAGLAPCAWIVSGRITGT
jgi:GNAT superfamily N-acetyltransferase